MTKILVWNLQRFTATNLVPEYWVRPNLENPNRDIGDLRWTYPNTYGLVQTIRALDPDIFVVVEVQSERNNMGQQVTGSGQQGLLLLLNWLRRFGGSPNWCLVPALQLNGETDLQTDDAKGGTYVEGIGVYFRSDRLNFVGPWMWPNGLVDNIIKRGCPIGYRGLQGGPYPTSYQNCLPAGNYYAGQYYFTYGNDPVFFSQAHHRRPWLTKFVDRQGRTINLMSVHLVPSNEFAAMEAIYNIVNKVADFGVVPNNTVSVICGDFNIDMNNANTRQYLYRYTNTLSWQWAINEQPGGTMLKPNSEGGATAESYLKTQILDNAIVRYGQNMVASVSYPYNSMIVNPVEGVNNHNPQMPSTMANSLQELRGIRNQFRRMSSFSSSANYGHIASPSGLSDHLPIYFEV